MRRLPLVLAVLLLCSCDQPPHREIEAAEAMLERARKDDAETLAPERLKEAETALNEARQKLQQRDYRGALSSATDATEKARSASKAAAAARAVGASAARVAQAEVESALEEVTAIREEAAKARVPDKVFEALQPRADQARRRLQALTLALEGENPAEVQKEVAQLKAEVAPLPALYREAMETWQAEHRRGRGRRRR